MNTDTTINIDPKLFAQLSKSAAGTVAFAKLSRLHDLAEHNNTDIVYTLQFFYDEDRQCCIAGRIQTTLQLICNRCLNLYDYAIDTNFKLYPVTDYKKDYSVKQLDVVLMKNGLISIIDIIEDELILNLPAIPRHLDDDLNCQSAQKTRFLEYEASKQQNLFK